MSAGAEDIPRNGYPLCSGCQLPTGWHAVFLPALPCAVCTTLTLGRQCASLPSLDGPVPPQAAEALLDDLVGDVAGYIVALREPCYGGVPVTDEQALERARSIVAGLVAGGRIKGFA